MSNTITTKELIKELHRDFPLEHCEYEGNHYYSEGFIIMAISQLLDSVVIKKYEQPEDDCFDAADIAERTGWNSGRQQLLENIKIAKGEV